MKDLKSRNVPDIPTYVKHSICTLLLPFCMYGVFTELKSSSYSFQLITFPQE